MFEFEVCLGQLEVAFAAGNHNKRAVFHVVLDFFLQEVLFAPFALNFCNYSLNTSEITTQAVFEETVIRNLLGTPFSSIHASELKVRKKAIY